MKTLIIVLIVLLNIVLFAQSSNLEEKLAEYSLQLVNKISIGSSTEEVKNILGKPAVVEPGFPESDEILFFDEFPSDQVGQSNYTTWFYRLSEKKITYTVYEYKSYFINAVEVPISIYQYYEDKDSIYYQPICFINGQLVSLDLYQSYLNKDSVYYSYAESIDYAPQKYYTTGVLGGHFAKIESQEMELDKMILSTTDIMMYKRDYVLMKKESQERKIDKQHTASNKFLPVLCVIFEKGTNVVAGVKAYFQQL